jgi:hypothetical protein
MFCNFFMTFYLRKIMKMYQQKVPVRCRKTWGKKLFFIGVLKLKDENSRIQSRIRINWSEARILGYGSGSVPQCHGSTTLALTIHTGTGT